LHNLDPTLGFLRKTTIFRRELAKIAKHCDHKTEHQKQNIQIQRYEGKNRVKQDTEWLVLKIYTANAFQAVTKRSHRVNRANRM
jgi:hypothetical protein